MASVPTEVGVDVVKMDFMVKRSQLKGRFKFENYKNRWFVLKHDYMAYSDGELGVSLPSNMHLDFS